MNMIVDSRSVALSSTMLAGFRNLYEKEFPDTDEREEFDKILERVGGNRREEEPHSIILLYPDCEREDRVAGGMVVDWYERSLALHLIYIAVDRERRRQKTATRLINEGIPAIIEWIGNTRNVVIRNVFFESDHPLKAKKNDPDGFDPVLRLGIFERLGARVFNIPYIQPPLDSNRKRVEHLLLLTFTPFNEKGDRVAAEDLMLFLEDFYRGLGSGPDDEGLTGMRSVVESSAGEDGMIVPDRLTESHRYKFCSASVTLHFVDEESCHPRRETHSGKGHKNCKHFFSFEKDLMNYQNQKNPPFGTCLELCERNVELTIPGCYGYISEGVSHLKLAERRSVGVSLSLSATYVRESGCRICHLTLSPSGGGFFTELDLIRLGTFFGSVQENIETDGPVMLKTGSGQQTITDFLVARCGGGSFRLLRSGIVQIDAFRSGSWGLPDMCRFFEIFASDKKTSMDADMEIFSKSLCGIVLGIFDFERMEDEEIFDTILPIVRNNRSFVVMCRGTVLKISDGNSFMQSIATSLTVSPYLLIPNVVLSYNEFILEAAMQSLNAILPSGTTEVSALEELHRRINNTLNADFLRDPFQYPSEREMIRHGNLQRGITTAYDRLSGQLMFLAGVIEGKRDERKNRSNAVVQALLGVVAAMQLYSVFKNVSEFGVFDLVFCGICLTMAVLLYRLIRNQK